jgi:hypothetical protein
MSSTRRGAEVWFRAGIVVMLTVLFGLVMQGCAGRDSPDDALTPTHTTIPPAPVATPWTFGSFDAVTLDRSVLPVRIRDEPDSMTGAAVVVNDAGVLLSHTSALDGDVEITLPNGAAARPVLLATDQVSGLILLKVPAEQLSPARFSLQRLSNDDTVYAAGFDGAPDRFGQIGGTISAVSDEEPSRSDLHVRGPAMLETNIPLITGFRGSALSDDEGHFAGIIMPYQSPEGHQVVAAISSWYVSAWLEHWRVSIEELSTEAMEWPSFETGDGWVIRYPHGWTVIEDSHDSDDFRYELAPEDPDAILRLAISSESLDVDGGPLAFAVKHFGDRRGAAIWGELEVSGYPGVRVVLEQEGALIDIVYVFEHDRLLTFSMTSGYLPGDASVQAEQTYKLFDTVVRFSMTTDEPQRPSEVDQLEQTIIAQDHAVAIDRDFAAKP